MTKKCLLITGGESVSKKCLTELVNDHQFIIGVDRGADTAFKYGIHLDLVIGDLDSISSKSRNFFKDKLHTFPAEKDFTDTDLAIEEAIKRGFEIITITGLYGNRIDHMLANLMLAFKYSKAKIAFVGERFLSYPCPSAHEIVNQKGKLFSIIPISHCVKGVTLQGFKYPLKEKDLYRGESIGISNIILEDHAYVTYYEGDALVFIYEDREDSYANNIS